MSMTGPNNQWAHAEYIENPVNKWSQCVQWEKVRYIQNVPSYVNLMYPVGKCWSHSKCTQPCDSNVPRGYMVITFKMSPSIWSQCAQWGHGDHIHNVPSDTVDIGVFSTPEYPSFMFWIGQIFLTFSLLVYDQEIFCNSGTKTLGDCQDIPVRNIVIGGFWLVCKAEYFK